MSANIPARSFYSKNKNKRLLDIEAKLELAETLLKKRPVPQDLPRNLLGPPVDWKVFIKQEEALKYAKDNGMGLMTFAFEDRIPGSEGRRKYLATHPSNMWLNHEARPVEERCTYEVIPHGNKCKLYFDLEFNKSCNPESCGEQMVELLLTATIWAFQEIFNLHMSKSDALVLDASTATKFSQHLIFQSAEFAFQDNIHAGNFVRFIVEQLKENKIPNLSTAEHQSLFVKNEKGDSICFCDLAVYTKNRNFRLFLSSKFGKNAPLVVGRNNCFRPLNDGNEAFFRSSLITFFEDEKRLRQLLTYGNPDQKAGYHSSNPSSKNAADTDPSLNGYNFSPWNEIDRFIMQIASPGTIRQWVYYEKTETIVYHIQGSRYCASIGREHKRNHIKYVVNMPHATYYQSCFDPDCAQSRPPPLPIPAENLPWFKLMDDADLLE